MPKPNYHQLGTFAVPEAPALFGDAGQVRAGDPPQ
jgi:hypothetical protein